MNKALRLLSAGAAQGVVSALAPTFKADTGIDVDGGFVPVGVVKEKILAGDECDIVVSTPVMLDEFARGGRIDAATIALLGRVHTAVAVRSGEPFPAIDDPDHLRAALVAATRVHVPDPERATAGIHFVKVLRELEIYAELLPRLATHANGTAAMRGLAAAPERGALGCTQATEIAFTPGVSLVGALPGRFDLATPYAVAVSTSARDPALGRRFVALLAGVETAPLRRRAGFEE